MRYEERDPYDSLRDHVKCLWMMEREYTSESPSEDVAPDSCIRSIFGTHPDSLDGLLTGGGEWRTLSDAIGGHVAGGDYAAAMNAIEDVLIEKRLAAEVTPERVRAAGSRLVSREGPRPRD